MTTKTKVAFRITGEAITELAQAFVIEGDVRQADVEHTLSNIMSMYAEGIPLDVIPYYFVTNYELTDN